MCTHVELSLCVLVVFMLYDVFLRSSCHCFTLNTLGGINDRNISSTSSLKIEKTKIIYSKRQAEDEVKTTRSLSVRNLRHLHQKSDTCQFSIVSCVFLTNQKCNKLLWKFDILFWVRWILTWYVLLVSYNLDLEGFPSVTYTLFSVSTSYGCLLISDHSHIL